MEILQEIRQLIAKNRPNLSASSIRTYASFLNSLYKQISKSHSGHLSPLDVFQNIALCEEHLAHMPIVTRKTILSALYVFTEIQQYKDDFIALCKQVDATDLKQEKNAKQESSWVTHDELVSKFQSLREIAVKVLNKKQPMDINFMVHFLLFSVCSGLFFPPRRSSDYANMKWKNYNANTDNYYDKKTGRMVFNSYKTAKFYGQYVLNLKEDCPVLYELFSKWIKFATSEYLFFSRDGLPLKNSQITKYLNDVFNGRKISVNTFRHVYLTGFYSGDTPSLEAIKEIATYMGHSIETSLKYVKHDVTAEGKE